MSAVRKWNRFLGAVLTAFGILILGFLAFRAEVIKDPSVAFWPMFGVFNPDLRGEQPLSSWAPFAVAQVAIWTLLAYFLFSVVEGIRRSGSRKRKP